MTFVNWLSTQGEDEELADDPLTDPFWGVGRERLALPSDEAPAAAIEAATPDRITIPFIFIADDLGVIRQQYLNHDDQGKVFD